ncbi:MAG: hypothetical protein KDD56_05295 [Bdellovibrionales bacterium]|nr:hypothetical protein [Bdellovibrionales bacterium]
MRVLPTIKILFEDENLFAFSKPAKLHSIGKTDSEPSAALMAAKFYPKCKSVGGNIYEHGLLNRLDFHSTGIILAAKTQLAWEEMRKVYKAKKIYKEYIIFVDGEFDAKKNISAYLGNPNRRAKKVRVYQEKPRQKDRAVLTNSSFLALKKIDSLNASICRVLTSTGARHQVRAHASFLGHPLCGDELYGSSTKLTNLFPEQDLPEFILHASVIKFQNPWSKNEILISEDLPKYNFLET